MVATSSLGAPALDSLSPAALSPSALSLTALGPAALSCCAFRLTVCNATVSSRMAGFQGSLQASILVNCSSSVCDTLDQSI